MSERRGWSYKLVPIQQIEDKENFVGTICYEGSFQIEKVTGKTELLLNTVYEGARVSVNGSKKRSKDMSTLFI